MTDSYGAVWAIDERDFPEGGGDAGRLRFALRYAILAPSGHNGQPWQFQVDDDLINVRADRSRALPAVELLPDHADPDLLATIRLGARAAAPESRDVFDAVLARHSNRHPYQARAVPAGQLARLGAAAAAEGAWLEPITDRPGIAAAADLIAEGDRIKWREGVFRHELSERIIPNRGHRRDGMPGYAFGLPGPLAHLAPGIVRRVDLGRLRARSDRALAMSTPALAVIGTDQENPAAWMAAGRAMSQVLLRATADGLATSFLSQAIEVPQLRPRLASLLRHDGHPQLLLRVGYPRRPARSAPRRPVEDVLVPAGSPAAAARGRGPVPPAARR